MQKNILIVSDIKGYEDEGMKKIARNIYNFLKRDRDFFVENVSVRQAISQINLKKFNVVHCIGGPTYRTVIACKLFKIIDKNVKTVITFTNPIWNTIADLCISLFPPDYNIVQSNEWSKWAQDKKLNYELQCVSGVDLKKFVPISKILKEGLRKKYNFPLKKILVLHVGHLKENRNLESLYHAQNDNDIQVVIVGSSTTKQSKDLIQRLENNGIIVLKRYIQNIEEIYQASDCYIFPTENKEAAVQMPLSVLEAMATNLPIVTTNFGALSTFFEKSSGFVFVDKSDYKFFSNIIKSVILKSKMNRKYIENYSWENIVYQLKNFYQKIIEG